MGIEICGDEGLYLPEGNCECPEGGGPSIEKVLYADLKAMRDAGELTPGQLYRIIDYEATTTQEGTRAVSHPFDIVVVADSENTLNENARAMLRRNDSYYTASDSGADLSAWRLKYTVDNDQHRFFWADPTHGKGVVFFMEDENNNVAPYDFKQLQFAINQITDCPSAPDMVGQYGCEYIDHEGVYDITYSSTTKYAYTFTIIDQETGEIIDYSVKSRKYIYYDRYIVCHDNIIYPATLIPSGGEGSTPYVPLQLNHIVLVRASVNAYEVYGNIFRPESKYNIINHACTANEFGEGFHDNIGASMTGNKIGMSCGSSIFNGFYNNTLGASVSSNVFDVVHDNTFGHEIYWCKLHNFSHNIVGNQVTYTTNAIGFYSFSNNILGNNINHVSFTGNFSNNTFGNHITWADFTAPGSGTEAAREFTVLNGTTGAYNSPLAITMARSRDYSTFIGLNSSGVLKQWVPADSVT